MVGGSVSTDGPSARIVELNEVHEGVLQNVVYYMKFLGEQDKLRMQN